MHAPYILKRRDAPCLWLSSVFGFRGSTLCSALHTSWSYAGGSVLRRGSANSACPLSTTEPGPDIPCPDANASDCRRGQASSRPPVSRLGARLRLEMRSFPPSECSRAWIECGGRSVERRRGDASPRAFGDGDLRLKKQQAHKTWRKSLPPALAAGLKLQHRPTKNDASLKQHLIDPALQRRVPIMTS